MSGILYPILILTLFLIVQILTMMASRKAVLDKNKQQLLDSVNLSNKIYSNEELSILVSNLMEQQEQTLDKVYPVGSIYVSYSNTNPASLFGGTWVAYATGRTLVGVDTSQSEFNSVGKTGGEKSHLLTEAEMPKHSHHSTSATGTEQATSRINWVDNIDYQTGYSLAYSGLSNGQKSFLEIDSPYNITFKERGGSQSHNNLQPYITVYMFRRTA